MAKAVASGTHIWDFWKNHWPEGHFIDDSEIEVEGAHGECLLNPVELYFLDKFGFVVNEKTDEARSFKSVFLKWKKEQDLVQLVIQIPKDQVEAVKLFFKECNVNVLG